MEKAGTLPQGKRVTRKMIVENSAAGDHEKIAISHDERHRMIAEAAHYRAQKRSSPNEGDAVADWLAAEAEIDAMITAMLANLALAE
ncbi:MAG: DUF2934 domain-containing protein [Sulfuriferula sp.]